MNATQSKVKILLEKRDNFAPSCRTLLLHAIVELNLLKSGSKNMSIISYSHGIYRPSREGCVYINSMIEYILNERNLYYKYIVKCTKYSNQYYLNIIIFDEGHCASLYFINHLKCIYDYSDCIYDYFDYKNRSNVLVDLFYRSDDMNNKINKNISDYIQSLHIKESNIFNLSIIMNIINYKINTGIKIPYVYSDENKKSMYLNKLKNNIRVMNRERVKLAIKNENDRKICRLIRNGEGLLIAGPPQSCCIM